MEDYWELEDENFVNSVSFIFGPNGLLDTATINKYL